MSVVTTADTATPAPAQPGARRGSRLVIGLVVLLGVIVVLAFLSVTLGTRPIPLADVVDAFVRFNTEAPEDRVAVQLRVPRTLLGILAGAALAISGVLLQGLTRNPLADPGIMGIEAGATVAVVFSITAFGVAGITSHVGLAFVGAVIATALVYAVGSLGRGGATPVKMALAGAAIAAGLTAITSGLVLIDIDALNKLRFWQVGSLAGRYAPIVTGIAPFLLVGIVLAMCCGRTLNGLALGDDVARGLGMNLFRTRLAVFTLVAVLCGAATAACGPIVFVGLIVAHIARFVCGPDYRWVLPYAALLGPVLLLGSDLVGRLISGDGELQVGVVLGVIGAPVFIGLVRYGRLSEL